MFQAIEIIAFSRIWSLAPAVMLMSFSLFGADRAPTSLQEPVCHTCSFECPYEGEIGSYCEPNGPGSGGSDVCLMEIREIRRDPEDPESDGFFCYCRLQGDLCWADSPEGGSFAASNAVSLPGDAIAIVAGGGMLPADGLFYVGVAEDELRIRWKCNGRVAGRVEILSNQAPWRIG